MNDLSKEPGQSAETEELTDEIFEANRDRLERLARLAVRALDLPAATVVSTLGESPEVVVSVGSWDLDVPGAETVFREVASGEGVELVEWTKPGSGEDEEESGELFASGFCAGVPLEAAGGTSVGLLCVIGERLGTWTSVQGIVIEEVGRAISDALELHWTFRRLQQANEELNALIEASPIAIVAFDRDGCVERWSRGAERIFGFQSSEVLGERVPFVPDEEIEEFEESVAEIFAGREIQGREIERETKHGERRILKLHAAPIFDADGSVRKGIATLQDVTNEKRRERALEKSEERFRRIFEESGVGIALVGLSGHVQKANPALAEMLGYEPWELAGTNFEDFTHPEDVEKDVELFDELVREERTRYQIEKRYVTKSEESRWGRLTVSSVTDREGQPLYVLAMIEDITAQKEAEQELVFRAQHDSLTGLMNRNTFEERLRRRIEEGAQTEDYGYALLFLDLDDLKGINDRLGHRAGDQLLVEVGERLEELLRSGDAVARLGGDEFAVLLEYVGGRDEVVIVGERLQTGLAAPVSLEGEVIYPSASIGIALGDASYEESSEMLRDADSAMYRAKDRGGGTYWIADDPDGDRADRTRELGAEVERALEQRDLELQFRPVVDLEEGTLRAGVAEPTWQHPERGLVSSQELRRAAENVGAYAELEHWMIDEACRRAASLRESYSEEVRPKLHVPLLNTFSTRTTFIEALEEQLEGDASERREVTVGLPERQLSGERAGELEILEAYREFGLGVGLEHYGSGSMSLRLLNRLELEVVMLEPGLIRMTAAGKGEASLLQTVVSVAESFDQRVVATGVESEEERNRLRDVGCRWATGSAIGEPLDLDAFRARLEEDRQ